VVSFFDEIIDPRWLRPINDNRRARWLGPPDDVIPGYTNVRLSLYRANDLAIWLVGADVFPDGVRLSLETRWRTPRSVTPPVVPGARGREGLCLGVELGGGRRLLATSHAALAATEGPVDSALVVLGTGAETFQNTTTLWLWPLPHEDVTWVLEWRLQGVPEVRTCLMNEPLRDTCSAAERVWPSDSPTSNLRPRRRLA
jgi:hypothetical protein